MTEPKIKYPRVAETRVKCPHDDGGLGCNHPTVTKAGNTATCLTRTRIATCST